MAIGPNGRKAEEEPEALRTPMSRTSSSAEGVPLLPSSLLAIPCISGKGRRTLILLSPI